MKGILTLILIAAVAIGAYWFFWKEEAPTMKDVQHGLAEGAREVGDAIDSLDTDQLKEELQRSGRIVRERSARVGEAVKDVTADARISTAIKAKLAADTELSALTIHVSTTDGVVTLSGTVPSHEALSKAMRLALDTDGVQKVESTLQVSP